MKRGRPTKYQTPEEMEKKLDEYFSHCEEVGDFPNVIGMALFLGFADRQSLRDNEQRSSEFSFTIKINIL